MYTIFCVGEGVVRFSNPLTSEKGGASEFNNSMGDHDNIDDHNNPGDNNDMTDFENILAHIKLSPRSKI